MSNPSKPTGAPWVQIEKPKDITWEKLWEAADIVQKWDEDAHADRVSTIELVIQIYHVLHDLST